MGIEHKSFDEVAQQLSRNLAPEVGASMLAIGAEIQDRLAPYPAAPARKAEARRWYERGYGWRTKSGKGDRAVSEQMNRRWDIQPKGLSAEVVNLASYSGGVQGKDQLAIFKRIGWPNETEVVAEVENDGTVVREVEDAIRRTFKGLVE
jgi:hypothetical protein